jgi:manganese/zinc/iron transport system substrate-binding protein
MVKAVLDRLFFKHIKFYFDYSKFIISGNQISMLKLIHAVAFMLAASLVTGCERLAPVSPKEDAKPVVVATTTHMADLVRQIGGNHFTVIPLMKAGVDPHSYRATAKDITCLQSADLIVFHGLDLEGKMARILKETKRNSGNPFSPCENLSKEELLNDEDGTNSTDPHLWFSPDLWIQCGQQIARKLIELLPDKSSMLQANLKKFRKSVEEIDQWGKSLIETIPSHSRILITSHDAFRYFGEHFGIQVLALQGINTLAEAGLADRANLVQFIKKNKSPALFIESSVNPKALQEIARETGSVIGGTLFSDALGTEAQRVVGPNGEVLSAATWQGMMAHNLSTIQKALVKAP